jgi:hypothetical protein
MSDQGNQDRGNLAKQETTQQQPNAGPNPLPIPPELESALRNIGFDIRDANASKFLAAVSLTTMVSGSLPFVAPSILEQYKNVDPKLVDKLIEWTEAQAQHRRSIEERSGPLGKSFRSWPMDRCRGGDRRVTYFGRCRHFWKPVGR